MSMRDPIPWRSIPLRTRIIFLAAVFCVFAGIGLANDVIDLGRFPIARFSLSVGATGLFAIGYAASGIILRHRFWKVMLPLMVVQFASMGFLAHFFPDTPQAAVLNASGIARLHNRMAWDGIGVIVSIVLGYIGFVHVSVAEARRYARTHAENAALESEMAAAREVQRMMVPEDLPTINGYTIESVYCPAAEVGGDFFQVIPLQSGRALIIIGDVSGKGLRAAMIVSMIVGMVHTVTGFTEEPVEILEELNRRLCGRTHGSFATCLAVRLEQEGRLTIANAGHPSPYVNGREVPFEGSVPLGLIEAAAYTQSTLDLRAGEHAVLLTDGVPEARDKSGALLGFPRLEGLLRTAVSAKRVAEAAQQHGQNDDITVIGIARQAQTVASVPLRA